MYILSKIQSNIQIAQAAWKEKQSTLSEEELQALNAKKGSYWNRLSPEERSEILRQRSLSFKVSVFSAGRAKIIISKYLNEYDTIFDPFSGFSGRLLGTIACGKRYVFVVDRTEKYQFHIVDTIVNRSHF